MRSFITSHGTPVLRLLRSALLLIFSSLLMQACADRPFQVSLPQDMPQTWDVVVGQEIPVTSQTILDLLDEPVLDTLAREALNNNPELTATGKRLLANEARLGITRAELWPSVDLGVAGGRGNETYDSDGQRTSASLHRVNLDLSWELDVWGKLRDGLNSDRTLVAIRQLEYEGARDSLIARTIQAWVRAVGLANSLRISEERVTTLKRIQQRILFRYIEGIGSVEGLSTANTRILSAMAEHEQIVEARSQAIRELELLLGRYPENLLIIGRHYPEIELPKLFYPQEVLLHRPDIRIAMEQVRLSELELSVARKQYLPSFLLNGRVMREAVQLSDLLDGTIIWDIVLATTQPVFQGGRIRSEVEARTHERSASTTELRSSVQTAIGEVREFWGNEQMLSRRETLLQSASLEATKSYQYFEKRYIGGLDPIINMLDAKEEEIAIQAQINEIQAARLINRIDLALALGYGENHE